jgi:hypothetical protein
MSTGNQGQGQGQGQGRRGEGHDRNNGGQGRTQGQNQGQPQGQAQGAGQGQGQAQGMSQGLTDVGNRVREGYDAAREEFAHRYRRVEGSLARNPTPSVFIAFGVGFGLGLALTAMLTEHHEETWAEKYLPDSLRNLPDSFRKSVPHNVRDMHWSDAYSQLCEAVHNLPSAISKAVHS